MRWPKIVVLMVGITAALGAAGSSSSRRDLLPAHPAPFTGELSVLTYNVKGLPWPLAWGRPADFLRMADRLRTLGPEGRRPQIVVLQEAFTGDARHMGREAGYRYIADGPDATRINPERPTRIEAGFLSGATWQKGEGLGKALGSGLQVLSDYPIVRTRAVAFPSFACAGFDCLANKGALMVSVRLPGSGEIVDIVTTHFNSRGKSGVGDARSDLAYRMQAETLTNFIRANHDPDRPLIVAGDFNIGTSAFRREELVGKATTLWAGNGPMHSVYADATARRLPLSADAEYSRYKAKDWQFFNAGRQGHIDLRRVDIPFGRDADGAMLSDHIGYTAVFSLSAPSRTE